MADSKIAYRTVNVDGVDIFYREAGPKDARTVLLFHGFPSSSHRIFLDTARALLRLWTDLSTH